MAERASLINKLQGKIASADEDRYEEHQKPEVAYGSHVFKGSKKLTMDDLKTVNSNYKTD